MLLMGGLGYLLRKLDFETAPIVLGVVLAPMLEMALRQSLAMSDGQYSIFVARPISATLLGVGLILITPSPEREMNTHKAFSRVLAGGARGARPPCGGLRR